MSARGGSEQKLRDQLKGFLVVLAHHPPESSACPGDAYPDTGDQHVLEHVSLVDGRLPEDGGDRAEATGDGTAIGLVPLGELAAFYHHRGDDLLGEQPRSRRRLVERTPKRLVFQRIVGSVGPQYGTKYPERGK